MAGMLIPLITAAIGAGSTIFGSLAANKKQQSALQSATQVQGASSERAIESLLELYGRATGALSPYSEAGRGALSELERLTYGGERPTPTGGGTSVQQQQPQTRGQRFGGNRNSYFGLPQDITNALGVGSGTPGGFDKTPVTPGLFNRTNTSKDRATQGINEIAKLWWGESLDGTSGLAGALKDGKITVEEANQSADFLYKSWIQNMKVSGVDPSIIQRSINTSGRGNTRSAMFDWRDFVAAYEAGESFDPLRQVSGMGGGGGSSRNEFFETGPDTIPVHHELVEEGGPRFSGFGVVPPSSF